MSSTSTALFARFLNFIVIEMVNRVRRTGAISVLLWLRPAHPAANDRIVDKLGCIFQELSMGDIVFHFILFNARRRARSEV